MIVEFESAMNLDIITCYVYRKRRLSYTLNLLNASRLPRRIHDFNRPLSKVRNKCTGNDPFNVKTHRECLCISPLRCSLEQRHVSTSPGG